ncbi:MAG: cytochrome b [Steroidobacteraceae bacterium]
MNTATAPAGYTRTAVSLHWLIALLIFTAFIMGWTMTSMAISPQKLKLFNYHKWVGVTVLGLALLRLLWRLTHRAPPLLPMPAWQRISAHALHGLLYLLMLLQPLTGWLYSNAVGYPIVYLGHFPLPTLVHKDKQLAATFENLHGLLGWLLAGVLALHIAAALKHHLIDRDDTLRRMLSWRAHA